MRENNGTHTKGQKTFDEFCQTDVPGLLFQASDINIDASRATLTTNAMDIQCLNE